MNDIDELADELTTIINAAENSGIKTHYDIQLFVRSRTALQEMQAKLSAPLPDEVEKFVNTLRKDDDYIEGEAMTDLQLAVDLVFYLTGFGGLLALCLWEMM